MNTVKRFRTDTRGATAVIFAFAVIPAIGLLGAAIDYSCASLVKTKMQKAVDGTALALVSRSSRLNDGELSREGQRIFRTMFQADGAVSHEPVTIRRNDRTIAVSVNGAMTTSLVQVLGIKNVSVGARTEVVWRGAAEKIELALVLDNTGSMNEVVNGKPKLDWLKTEMLRLLAKLRAGAAAPEDVKVALIPFDTQVRVDADEHRYASWLRLDESHRSKWYGYIEDRGDDAKKSVYDTNDMAADRARPESLYPAVLHKRGGGRELAVARPLTSLLGMTSGRNGYSTLETTINDMRGVGCTNITIGAAWGMAALSRAEPFIEATEARDEIKKIMVIVTDGDNTKNRWDGDCQENTPASAQIDQRTQMACAEAKARGIKVITIRLVEGNKKLLKDCASTVSDPTSPFYNQGKPLFYNVQNPLELDEAFRSFTDMLLGTRLTM